MLTNRIESVESTFKEKMLRERVQELEVYVEELERALLFTPGSAKQKLEAVQSVVCKEKQF